jgi:hypothetical protein
MTRGGERHQFMPAALWALEFGLCLSCASRAAELRFAECRKCRAAQKAALTTRGFSLGPQRSLVAIGRDPVEEEEASALIVRHELRC